MANPVAKRTITALATAAGLVALFLFAPLWVFFPVLLALSCLAQLEFYRLAAAQKPVEWFGVFLGVAWLAAMHLFPNSCGGVAVPFCFLGFAAAPVLFILMLTVSFDRRRERPVESAASTLLGFLYVPFMLSFCLLYLKWDAAGCSFFASAHPCGAAAQSRSGLYALFTLLAATKASDMGGYAFGMAFGRHKMCPSISPKKSWEGFAGSVLAAALAMLLFRFLAAKNGWQFHFMPVWRMPAAGAAMCGAAVAAAGTLGDLVESRIKRAAGAKDSSSFMPAGMGGFLDMLDSVMFIPALNLLFAIPLCWQPE